MRWYRELLPSLPEELSGWIGLITIPPAPPFPEALWGRKACVIVWCYTGSHDRADAVIEPVSKFGSPLLVGVQPMPFDVLQSAFDGLYPAGLQWYWRADFFNEISDAAIEVHVKYGEQSPPTGHSTMHMYPIDGAASRVPEGATSFAYRNGGWAGIIAGVDPDPANAGLISQWARDYWQELHPTSAGGAYINFMMNEGQDRAKRPTAATTHGSPRSRTATTPATPSTSTRTSRRPAGRSRRTARVRPAPFMRTSESRHMDNDARTGPATSPADARGRLGGSAEAASPAAPRAAATHAAWPCCCWSRPPAHGPAWCCWRVMRARCPGPWAWVPVHSPPSGR